MGGSAKGLETQSAGMIIQGKLKWKFEGDIPDISDIMDNSAELTAQLLDTLLAAQPELAQTVAKGRPRAFGTVRRLRDITQKSNVVTVADGNLEIEEPNDVVEYLKESDEFSFQKPAGVRVTLEPSELEFQGVASAVAKTVLLRYKAARGDREEKDLFIAVEPVDVFKVQNFHLHLQGDSALQLQVTFSPSALQNERAEGSLSVIDHNGRKLVSCGLFALKKSFIAVTPISLDAGWILPDKKKELTLKVENTSPMQVVVNYELESDVRNRTAASTAEAILLEEHKMQSKVERHEIEAISYSAFRVPSKTTKVQPGETRTIAIFFEPTKLGKYSDSLKIYAPGGEVIAVRLTGVAGIPIALYPESELNSVLGQAALTLERSEFINKFKRSEGKRARFKLTDDDISIIQNMMAASSPNERRSAHTMDFGICTKKQQSLMRCLTVFNMSDASVTIGLYSHHPSVDCPYLVHVPARMATTVEVTFTIMENSPDYGNFSTIIDAVCPEFQNIPLSVISYIGQPLYFACHELVFFKPVMMGRSQQLVLHLINDSHYDFHFNVTGQGLAGDEKQNYVKATIGHNNMQPGRIFRYSTCSIKFEFFGRRRGPFVQKVSLELIYPAKKTVPGTFSGKDLAVVGICIEPWTHYQGEVPDKNGIEFIRTWLSHPRRVLEEYPSEEQDLARRFDIGFNLEIPEKQNDPDIFFAKDELTFRLPKPVAGLEEDFSYRRATILPMAMRNKGTVDIPSILLTSCLFNIDPKSKVLKRGETDNADIMHTPPNEHIDQFTTFGFAAILSDVDHRFHSIQLLGKYFTDFHFYPIPTKEGSVIIDFGKIESSRISEMNVKYLMMFNTFKTPFSWNVKFAPSRAKFNAFETILTNGDLQSLECLALPFYLKIETTGNFESVVDIEVKEVLDRLAKATKAGNIVLRGQVVNTSLSGFPDILDFGSVFVSLTKSKTFVVTNNGSTETEVTILVKSPFFVTPKTFSLASKASQDVIVTFQPIESRPTVAKLMVFANHKLYIVRLSGTGGTAELVCEKYAHKVIEFGPQREGSVAWINVYLTNKGTLSLKLNAITADLPDLVKIEFLGISSTMPLEKKTISSKSVAIKRDFWAVLRRKLQIFALWSFLSRRSPKSGSRQSARRKVRFSDEFGDPLEVSGESDSILMENQLSLPVPPVKPFYSYHLKIGYLNKYQPKKDTNVYFHYVPITTEDAGASESLTQKMQIRILGNVYRPLEFYPSVHDFGIVPAESWTLIDSLQKRSASMWADFGVQMDAPLGPNTFALQILNLSMETQNLSLDSINSEFTVNGRHWHVSPGEKLEIPIEFHPAKEQLQYQGKALFSHNYGEQVIYLSGTGASAEVSADDVLDFGSLKIGSKGQRKLRICNRGLLEARYMLQINQPGTDYRILNSEPFEHEGKIGSGIAELIEFQCVCQGAVKAPSHIALKWERIPNGIWEDIVIPIAVEIGIPQFRVSALEIDFTTTYINVNKTILFPVINDGNASCAWRAEWESSVMLLDPDSGVLEPGESVNIFVTYAPDTFESLHCSLQFITDAGPPKTIMCYGIVGIPYLSIPDEQLNRNFDIVSIDKTHVKPLNLTNTGPRPIEYEITLTEPTKDGIPSSNDDFTVFFATPTHGIIQPGETFNAQLECLPRNYGSTVSACLTIRTRDGEQYVGYVTATGGRAIIKIAPPKVEAAPGERLQTAQMNKIPSRNSTRFNAKAFDAARLVFQTHIENLQDVLAGLRTAEIELGAEELYNPNISNGVPTEMVSNAGARIGLTSNVDDLLAKKFGNTLVADHKANLLKLGQLEEALRTKSKENREKQIAAGKKVFDGSDLRGRVKRAAQIAALLEEQEKEDRSSKKWSDGNSVLQRTGSGKVRITSKSRDATAAGSSQSDEPSSSAKPLADIENSAALKVIDNLSMLENELELLSRSIDAVGAIIASGSEIQADGSQIHPGYGRYTPGTAWLKRNRRGGKGIKKKVGKHHEDFDSPIGRFGDTADEEASSKREIEDMMALAQQILTDSRASKDSDTQKRIIDDINSRLIESTKGVISVVREQLRSKWIENREFLSSALKRVQDSSKLMEAISVEKPAVEQMENEFDLGLIKANTKMDNTLLFNLPNVGNLAFDFVLKRNLEASVYPQDYGAEYGEKDVFDIQPLTGTVPPGETVTFSASVFTSVAGAYSGTYDMESNGEKMLSFIVTIKVGVPKLHIEPQLIDFGLISKNKSDQRTVIIANVGSFRDFWRLENLGEKPSFGIGGQGDEIFTVSHMDGALDPNESIPLSVQFSPREEGNFSARFELRWSGAPLAFELKGVGGGAKIKPEFQDKADINFGGFDFGTCVVSCRYSHQAKLHNFGNVNGVVRISHPRQSITFESPLFDSQGRLLVAPGESADITVCYNPVTTEAVKESIQVDLEESGPTFIVFRALSGTRSWLIDGELGFKNMPITDIQVGSLTLKNTGGLDLPIIWTLNIEDEHRGVVKLNIKEIKNCKENTAFELRPGQVVHIEVTITPKAHTHIIGNITLSADLGRGFQPKTYDLNVVAYDKQLAVDDSKDTSIGRIMYGSSVEVSRQIVNYGVNPVKYRVRLEPFGGDDEKLQESGSVINVVEASTHGKLKKGKKKKSKMNIVDSSADLKRISSKQNPWKIVKGGSGTISSNGIADITVIFESSEECGEEWHEVKLIIEKCEDETRDKWSEISAFSLNGAGGIPKLAIMPSICDFEHNGLSIEKLQSVVLSNEGSAVLEYKFETPWDFDGNIYFSAESGLSGSIDPGASVEISVDASLSSNDPELGEPIRSEFLSVSPEHFYVEANSSENPSDASCSFAEIVIYLQAPHPVDKATGVADQQQIAQILSKGTKRHFLLLETIGGSGDLGKQVVAVTFQFGIEKLVAITTAKLSSMRATGNMAVVDADCLSALHLDAVNMDTGGTLVFIVHNQSNIKVPFSALIDTKDFSVFPTNGFLAPKSFKEFQLEVKGLDFGDETEVPPVVTLSGALRIVPAIEQIPPIELKLSAELVDVVPEFEFPSAIDFGTIRKMHTSSQVLEFRNPVRRQIAYTLTVDRQFVVNASLETDLASNTLTLNGGCEEPSISLDTNSLSFGVVDTIAFYNMDMYEGQKNPEIFASIEVEGIGGNHGFQPVASAETNDENDPFTDKPVPPLPAGIPADSPVIRVTFARAIAGQVTRKYFEIENCGETMVDIAIVDHRGVDLSTRPGAEYSSTELCMYSASPSSVVIPPRQKAKFSVAVKGLKAGDDEFWLLVRTRTLLEAKAIPILVRCHIISPDELLLSGIPAFARADVSIEEMISAKAQEELKYNSENLLWKLLIPVVRVSPGMPSEELQHIPCVEPSTDLPDINHFIVRPPAIPKELPPRARKWYMNRTAMPLDPAAKQRIIAHGEVESHARHQQALQLVRSVEKQVVLEPRGLRRF
ncbi:hypothetical protein HK405_001063 [Cladochytrium tenue]|nr:hypothetical protein HK405_001063 [Cladochytrium tenue]